MEKYLSLLFLTSLIIHLHAKIPVIKAKINPKINGKISYLGSKGVKILKSKEIDLNKAKKDAPIAAIYSSPAVWQKKRLISAPIFNYSNNDSVNIEIKKIGYMI